MQRGLPSLLQLCAILLVCCVCVRHAFAAGEALVETIDDMNLRVISFEGEPKDADLRRHFDPLVIKMEKGGELNKPRSALAVSAATSAHGEAMENWIRMMHQLGYHKLIVLDIDHKLSKYLADASRPFEQFVLVLKLPAYWHSHLPTDMPRWKWQGHPPFGGSRGLQNDPISNSSESGVHEELSEPFSRDEVGPSVRQLRGKDKEALFDTKDYKKFTMAKASLTYHLLRLGYDVFLSDPDVCFFSSKVIDYMFWFIKHETQEMVITMERSTENGPTVNSGLYYVASSARTRAFWGTVLAAEPSGKRNQQVVNLLLRAIEVAASVSSLPRGMVNLPPGWAELGKLSRRTWRLDNHLFANGYRLLRNTREDAAFDVQYLTKHWNFIVGIDRKVKLLKEHCWYI